MSTPNNSGNSKKFQLNAKNICLTYPRCNISAHDAISQLQSIFPGAKYIITSSETHKDGGFHIHAGISLDTPFRTKSCSFADLRSRDGNVTFHANVQSARRFSAWIKYVKKDGNFVEIGDNTNNKNNNDINESELIEAAKTLDLPEFLAFCAVNRLNYAKAIWESFHKDNSITITAEQSFDGIIDERFLKLVNNIEIKPNLTLLIIGKSGIGKTTWAKQTIPKPCLFVTHLDDLRKFQVDYHVSILFDDVSFCHLPDTSQIHLLDYENPRSIHIRHTIARVPAGVRKIVTCNTVPASIHLEAISRRTQVIFCHEDDLRKY